MVGLYVGMHAGMWDIQRETATLVRQYNHQAPVSQFHPSLLPLDGLVGLWTTSLFEKSNAAHHITPRAVNMYVYVCIHMCDGCSTTPLTS